MYYLFLCQAYVLFEYPKIIPQPIPSTTIVQPGIYRVCGKSITFPYSLPSFLEQVHAYIIFSSKIFKLDEDGISSLLILVCAWKSQTQEKLLQKVKKYVNSPIHGQPNDMDLSYFLLNY